MKTLYFYADRVDYVTDMGLWRSYPLNHGIAYTLWFALVTSASNMRANYVAEVPLHIVTIKPTEYGIRVTIDGVKHYADGVYDTCQLIEERLNDLRDLR